MISVTICLEGSGVKTIIWGHPQVAVHLAQWISVDFQVQVSLWLVELQTKGTVSLPSSHPDVVSAPAPVMPPAPASLPTIAPEQQFQLNERLEKLNMMVAERKLLNAKYFNVCLEIGNSLDLKEDDRFKSILQSGFLNAVTRDTGGIPGGGGPVVPNSATDLDPLDRESSVSLRAEELYSLTLTPSHSTQIGKKLAAKYRSLHDGQDPPSRDQYVAGTLRKVKHYTERDWQKFGDDVMANTSQQRGWSSE